MTTFNQRMLTTAVLVSATVTTGSVVSLNSVFFAAYFGTMALISFYLLSRSEKNEDFFKTSKYEHTTKQGEVHLVGTVITSGNAEDRLEDRFLEHFELKNMAKRKVFSWIFLAAGIYLLHMVKGISVSASTLVPIASFLFIVNAFSVGQLLLAMLINVLVVVWSYTPMTNVFGLALYVALSFISISWISVVKNIGFSSRTDAFFESDKLVRVIGAATLFFLLLVGFSFLVPQRNRPDMTDLARTLNQPATRNFLKETEQGLLQLKDEVRKLPDSEMKEKLLGDISQNLNNVSMPVPNQEDFDRVVSSTRELRENYDRFLSESTSLAVDFKNIPIPELGNSSLGVSDQQLEQLSGFAERVESDLSLSAEDLENVRNFKTSYESDPQDQVDRAKVEKSLQKLLADLGEKGEGLASQRPTLGSQVERAGVSREEQQRLMSFVNRMKEKGLSQKDVEAVQGMEQMLLTQSLDQLDRTKFEKHLEQLRIQEKTLSEERAKELAQKKLEKSADVIFNKADAAAEKVKEEPNKSEDDYRKYLKYWHIVLLVLIILYLRRKLRKKGIETIEVPEPKHLPELRRRWKELGRLRLSPREEVIHYYNLFHESMQQFHYSTHEAPPSCVIHGDLQDLTPSLEKSSFVITELFCLCFYGNAGVSDKNLKTFRKAIKNFQKVYQLG